MNRRLLYVFLFVQGLFALSLIYVGTRAREGRKQDYLELTHRISSGHATLEDFEHVKRILPQDADANRVRALLGLPVQTAASIELASEKGKPRTGKFWIYYPEGSEQHAVDREAAEKLTGNVKCYIVVFVENGVRSEIEEVVHPIVK